MGIEILQEYHTENKDEWGEGPWQSEPDKIVWIDEDTGLDCMARRGPLGSWCGYVGVPNGHPWYQLSGVDADVHGGVTFANLCDEEGDPATAICHVPQPGHTGDVWWIGFDCSHFMDYMPAMVAREMKLGLPPMPEPGAAYRDLDYTVHECENLARQAAEAA